MVNQSTPLENFMRWVQDQSIQSQTFCEIVDYIDKAPVEIVRSAENFLREHFARCLKEKMVMSDAHHLLQYEKLRSKYPNIFKVDSLEKVNLQVIKMRGLISHFSVANQEKQQLNLEQFTQNCLSLVQAFVLSRSRVYCKSPTLLLEVLHFSFVYQIPLLRPACVDAFNQTFSGCKLYLNQKGEIDFYWQRFHPSLDLIFAGLKNIRINTLFIQPDASIDRSILRALIVKFDFKSLVIEPWMSFSELEILCPLITRNEKNKWEELNVGFYEIPRSNPSLGFDHLSKICSLFDTVKLELDLNGTPQLPSLEVESALIHFLINNALQQLTLHHWDLSSSELNFQECWKTLITNQTMIHLLNCRLSYLQAEKLLQEVLLILHETANRLEVQSFIDEFIQKHSSKNRIKIISLKIEFEINSKRRFIEIEVEGELATVIDQVEENEGYIPDNELGPANHLPLGIVNRLNCNLI
ncbi:MAG: hypothetical protein BGO14_08325 [Chlamydiales bacterium 38-26]|nr:hypothetical protein [Chlamydiales bacterium]OJV10996.1 MAG: hypothetical protein BGO14_08325 [Chlamydiales bacterium 38-26]